MAHRKNANQCFQFYVKMIHNILPSKENDQFFGMQCSLFILSLAKHFIWVCFFAFFCLPCLKHGQSMKKEQIYNILGSINSQHSKSSLYRAGTICSLLTWHKCRVVVSLLIVWNFQNTIQILSGTPKKCSE